MRLTTNKTSKGTSYYIIRSVKRNGKRSSEVVEVLGNETEICEKYHCTDAAAWAKAHLEELNQAEEARDTRTLVSFNTNALIPEGRQNLFNVGYLFLQQIYYDLMLPNICRAISERSGFEYNLDSILSRLVYGRILFPSSKRSCAEQSRTLLEQPEFNLHDIYRALSVIAEESDYIQSELYKNSRKIIKRQTGVLFYDCTNFFFETEQEEGLKKYGVSKEHRPSPIVQMGLFMDKTGIPLAFCINEGSTNEQVTMTPLEKLILKDFECSHFVVCTDSGLASEANRKFNNFGGRCFITTQSIKKLSQKLQKWCLDPLGWHLKGFDKTYDISRLENNEKTRNLLFYKEMYIEGYDEERDIPYNQTLIVTYSLKYRNYQRQIRTQQIERAKKTLAWQEKVTEKHRSTDYRRFIKKTAVTQDGEIAKQNVYEINEDAIKAEEKYDGFYAVCTNLEDDAAVIAQINHDRWEIEESFRIMKSEFEARPVYLKRDERIKAHFMTCFIALLIYRILEKKLDEKYSCEEIIGTLRKMNMTELGKDGYIPSYIRTELTDDLHKMAGFRTDYELIRPRSMKGVIRRSKE